MIGADLYRIPYHEGNLSDFKFLITGGAGFIGSNLVEYLLKYNAGHVRVLDNLSNGYFENIKSFIGLPNFEFIEGDIRDIETCKLALDGIHYVSHQAALGSVPRSINDPILTSEVNISGFLNILTAAKDQSTVKRMVYAASSSTYGDSQILPKTENVIGKPLSPYAVTKLVNEIYAEVFSKVYGFHTIGLRYFNVFGPNQSPDNPYAAVIPLFIKAAGEGKSPIIFGDGETSRDFTFVENVVQANIKSLLKNDILNEPIILNIACGRRTSLNDLWKVIARLSDVEEIRPEYLPERRGDIKDSLADITKAAQYLNYDPSFDVEKGISVLLRTK
jgi:UDP-N-acetylglucosamine/UDP-N-acetylgalactosamine 4-epimerase